MVTQAAGLAVQQQALSDGTAGLSAPAKTLSI
jgi:hypothetical protein